MEWVLVLGHALLGALLLPAAGAGEPVRRRAVEAASVAGVLLGVALVIAGQADAGEWRSVAFEARSTTPSGFVVAAAWLVTGALAARIRVTEAALTGVAASGLVLALNGRYVVPSLLFWLCASLALAATAGSRPRWALLAVSDAALCCGAVLHVVNEDTWGFGSVEGAPLAALAVAAAVRAAAFVVWGPGKEAAAVLVAGGGVALVSAHAGSAETSAALAFAVAAVAVAVAALLRSETGPRLLATWGAALALAVCFASPADAPVAGAAAALAIAAAALWPYTAGRGGVARALMVAAAPLTPGFVVVSGGALAAFERATTAGGDAGWAIVAVLLPAALVAGAVLGARVARTDAPAFAPEAILATWALLGAAIAVGIVPSLVGDAGLLGDSGGTLALQILALVAGAAGAIGVRRWSPSMEPRPVLGPPAETPSAPVLPQRAEWVIAGVAALVVVATAWLTVAGLRVGFL